jgi:hypothetical protein
MSFADDFVAAFEPWLTPALEDYLRAIATMFSEVELYAFDDDQGEGWEILFDPDRAPVKALPYLAQYVGEILPVGISEAGAREWIKDAPNQKRGTPRSIFLAAQRRLTGSRLVSMIERDGTVDTLTIRTYQEQTPDPEGTLQDLLDVVPADVILDYTDLAGQLWSDVKTAHATWADVKAAYPTWRDLAVEMGAGATIFERPRP